MIESQVRVHLDVPLTYGGYRWLAHEWESSVLNALGLEGGKARFLLGLECVLFLTVGRKYDFGNRVLRGLCAELPVTIGKDLTPSLDDIEALCHELPHPSHLQEWAAGLDNIVGRLGEWVAVHGDHDLDPPVPGIGGSSICQRTPLLPWSGFPEGNSRKYIDALESAWLEYIRKAGHDHNLPNRNLIALNLEILALLRSGVDSPRLRESLADEVFYEALVAQIPSRRPG